MTTSTTHAQTRRQLCCLLACVVFVVLPLKSQQQFLVTTIGVRPTVTAGESTLDIYNAHLSPGGFKSLRLCSSTGEIVQDLTDRVDASRQGLQSLEIDLSRCGTGVYFIVYVSRYEVATVKIVRIR